jgi:dienelactone hydrolase
MPDFFEPDPPFPISKFPPSSDQDKADLQDFFRGTANPGATTKKLVSFGEVLKKDGAKKVGVYGFCWGMLDRSLSRSEGV